MLISAFCVLEPAYSEKRRHGILDLSLLGVLKLTVLCLRFNTGPINSVSNRCLVLSSTLELVDVSAFDVLSCNVVGIRVVILRTVTDIGCLITFVATSFLDLLRSVKVAYLIGVTGECRLFFDIVSAVTKEPRRLLTLRVCGVFSMCEWDGIDGKILTTTGLSIDSFLDEQLLDLERSDVVLTIRSSCLIVFSPG